MKEITKLENTSLSDFKLHTEECLYRAILQGLFVPALVMSGINLQLRNGYGYLAKRLYCHKNVQVV